MKATFFFFKIPQNEYPLSEDVFVGILTRTNLLSVCRYVYFNCVSFHFTFCVEDCNPIKYLDQNVFFYIQLKTPYICREFIWKWYYLEFLDKQIV